MALSVLCHIIHDDNKKCDDIFDMFLANTWQLRQELILRKKMGLDTSRKGIISKAINCCTPNCVSSQLVALHVSAMIFVDNEVF